MKGIRGDCTKINLENCGLTDALDVYIFRVLIKSLLTNSRLKEINLNACNINEEEAIIIAEAIKDNQSLEVISLRNNMIGG